MIRIQEEDFSSEQEIARLVRGNPKIGGVVSFLGSVRDFTTEPGHVSSGVTTLILEHYPGMTEAELEKIEVAARERFAVEEILVVHRVGPLSVEENIVLVVAASAHRTDAFDACRFVIDHLKVRATFWKKEVTVAGGERWVHGCPGCEAAASQWDDLKQVAHVGHPVQVGGAGEAREAEEAEEAGEAGTVSPAYDGHGTQGAHDSGTQGAHTHPLGISWPGLRVGLLTLSDSRDRTSDRSGDALEGLVLGFGAHVAVREIMADDEQAIQALLMRWVDDRRLDVILTTGGTGPGPRDVTPEATRAVSRRELPGFGELIRAAGLQQTRHAVFTRGVAAFRASTLILNLPGSTRGAVHSLDAVADLVPHALRMARGGGHHG